jgi:hypothetical protein
MNAIRRLKQVYFTWLARYHELKIEDAAIAIRQAKNEARHHKGKAAIAQHNARVQ